VQQSVPPYAWTPVAVSDGEGAGVVSPGRYRVVIRYLPDETFSGDQVCVAVSPPFELVIPEGAEFTIVPFPPAEHEEGRDDV
ncbi:hypothetical protein RZS08_35315, partial [Arthrospira platensis SPKY1]|nr:hypothetical protein [Arthrospira platensis SPKY1]